MISICMATYNGERYIKEQLDSILPQIGKDDEIIISDDSSTDKTIEIIKSYQDTRIIVLEKQNFKSAIYNFENALKSATGNYIFLSDQDDKWAENKVTRMCEILLDYDLVVCDCYWFGSNTIGNVSNFTFRNAGKGVIKNIIKNGYLGNCMAFRAEILEKVLPFPRNIPMHDIWIGIIANIHFKVFFLSEKLSYWRRHDDNTTKLIGNHSPNSLHVMIIMRLNLIKSLVLRSLRK